MLVDGEQATRPGMGVAVNANLERKRSSPSYVGRGGDKLAPVLDELHLDVTGWRILDVGASTGGFTDAVLRRGARQVVAVDVGRGQLHPNLALRSEVVSLEGMDVRNANGLGAFDLVLVDVSFISLCLLVETLASLRQGGALLALVKPQFEVGQSALDKRGVVSDEAARTSAIERVCACFETAGLDVEQVIPAGKAGKEGNQEFFLWVPA